MPKFESFSPIKLKYEDIFAHRVHYFSVRARLHQASLCYDACNSVLITARKRSLCFHRCLSKWLEGGLPDCMLGYTTPRADAPQADTPQGRPPQGRLPQCRHPSLWAIPPGRLPWAYTPPCPVHTRIHTPLYSACWDTVNKRAVRIPLECILVENNGFTSNWGCIIK